MKNKFDVCNLIYFKTKNNNMADIQSENIPTQNSGGLLGSLGNVKLEHAVAPETMDRLLAVLVIAAFVWGGVQLLGLMFKKMIEKQ